MLKELRPKTFKRYLSLPLLGHTLDDFDSWLMEHGYRFRTRRHHITEAKAIDAYFQRLGRRSVDELSCEDLDGCWRWFHNQSSHKAGSVRVLRHFLQAKKLLSEEESELERGPFGSYLNGYATYLRDLRGITSQTTQQHLRTASEFLQHLTENDAHFRLADVTSCHVERFITHSGKRLSRGTLQHVVSRMRCFLRYLAMEGKIEQGLESQIDTPRVYRMEQLPRSLSWETVCAFLDSIEQESPKGLRDYTMFFLITSYGMRSCEIAALTLDDINWRRAEISVHQCKTEHALILPLTDKVGTVLLDYLHNARPNLPYRELFLRARAPAGPLKPTAVTEAFQAWSRRSGLDIPFQGSHCLRHSYAIHLLRQGVSMKSIGDLLGHRTTESTCVYLRFATEELREVALPLPSDCTSLDSWEE